mgnify:CR=1 FL=1
MSNSAADTQSIVVEYELSRPPEKVWRAIQAAKAGKGA